MNEKPGSEESLVFSYLSLRRTIGFLGTALPFVLFLGALIIFRTGLQSSMSSYYHTDMGDVLVGTMCVIGFFLFSYRGYERADNIAGDLGCIFAVCVALFPTAPDGPVSGDVRLIGYIHLACAALFFLTLIYFSLFLFTKTDPSKPITKRKRNRNHIYRVCGYVMSVCIVLMIIYTVLLDSGKESFKALHPIFWLEAMAVVAFGISWLTKGEAIMKDVA